MEAVAQLMAERAKYEKWLRELDAKKASTPQHVFERVRGDYTTRLDTVMEQLREHTTAMQEHARTLVARLRELEAAEQDLKDERAEQELRSQVGELTAGEWEVIERRAERALAKVREDQEAVANDLNRIRELIAGGDDETAPVAEPPRRSTDFNELEFLKSVVGPTTPAASSTPPRAAKRPEEAAPPKSADGSEPAQAEGAKASPKPESGDASAKASKSPEPAPKPAAAVQVTSDTPLVLRTSAASEIQKTLKCAECGAMNSPNEWYCERCGAELANI